MDEIALLKGYRDYVAVIPARNNAGAVHVVAVLLGHLKTTIMAWLMALPRTLRARHHGLYGGGLRVGA